MIFLQHEHAFNIIYPYTKSINNECQHYLHNFLFHIADSKIGSPSFKNKMKKSTVSPTVLFFMPSLFTQFICKPRKLLQIQCLSANRERPAAGSDRCFDLLFCKMQQI